MALFNNDSPSSDAEAIITAVEKLLPAKVHEAARGSSGLAPVMVLPEGQSLHSLKPFVDEYRERPERKLGNTRLTTLEAFIAFVQLHRTQYTVIFLDDLDSTKPRLRAIFNANRPTESDGATGLADFQDFTADYAFPFSDEWLAWTSMPKSFSQADFAEFLEDRILDVIDPSQADDITKRYVADLGVQLATAARLMALSKGLAVNVEARVVQALNLSTGEGRIEFSEEHKDGSGGQLNVPGAFAIGIPVFRLGTHYEMPVRLRYRAGSGRITWSLSLERQERVFERALEKAAAAVADQTDRPLFRGRVER